MSDSNARRDKALESIARELGETNKLLKELNRNSRRLIFKGQLEERPDPFDVPQQEGEPAEGPQTPSGASSANDSSTFPQPTHPYLKRSQPDDSGPYGLFPPRPYE